MLIDMSSIYLVLNRDAADKLRYLLDYPEASEPILRKRIIPALVNGEIICTTLGPNGTLHTLKIQVKGIEEDLTAVLCYGTDSEGKQKLAPDGKRQVVFLQSVEKEKNINDW
jgi:hypothetical protein